MLELDDGQRLMDELWQATTSKVEMRESARRAFFAAQGAEPLYYDNRRTYHRFYMRAKAVLKRSTSLHGTYTKDVSRQGVGFLSPVPLMPKERIKLRTVAAELTLEVTRCRRVDPGCFDCGAKFAL